MNRKTMCQAILSRSITVLLLLSLVGVGRGSPLHVSTAAAQGSQFAHFYGDLAPGEIITPTYPLFGSQNKNANMKMQVPTVVGGGTVDLTVTDGLGGNAFTDAMAHRRR